MPRQKKNGPPTPNDPAAAKLFDKLRPVVADLALAAVGYVMGAFSSEDLAAGRKFYTEYDDKSGGTDFFAQDLANAGLSRGEELRLRKLAEEWIGEQTPEIIEFIESGGLDDVGGIGGVRGFIQQVAATWLMNLSGDPNRPLAADFVAAGGGGNLGGLGLDWESFVAMGEADSPRGILAELNLSEDPDGDSTIAPPDLDLSSDWEPEPKLVSQSDMSESGLERRPDAVSPMSFTPPPVSKFVSDVNVPIPRMKATDEAATPASPDGVRTPEELAISRPPVPEIRSDVEIPVFSPKSKTSAPAPAPAPPPPPPRTSPKAAESAPEHSGESAEPMPDLELDEAIASAELETLSDAELNALLDGSDVEIENGDLNPEDTSPIVMLGDSAEDRRPSAIRGLEPGASMDDSGRSAQSILDAIPDISGDDDELALRDDDRGDVLGGDLTDELDETESVTSAAETASDVAVSTPAKKSASKKPAEPKPEPSKSTKSTRKLAPGSESDSASPLGRKSTRTPTGKSTRKKTSPPSKAPEIWRAPSARLAQVNWDRAARGEDLTKSTIGRVQQAALSSQEQETFNFLRTIPLFSLLPDQALFNYVRKLELRAATIGETIVTQGEDVDGLYLVYNGAVRLFYTNDDDQMVSLGILGKGDIIGEVAIADDTASPASARCSQDTTLLVLPREVLERDFKNHPAFHNFFNEYVREFYLRQFIRLWTGFGAGLAPKDLVSLVRQAETWKVSAGSLLYKQGAAADCFYVVKKGTVSLTSLDRPRDGRPAATREVDRIGEGEVFGATELIEADDREIPRRPVGAIARSDAEMLKIPRELLNDLLKQYPELRAQFARAYAENVLTGRDQKAQFDRAGILTSNPAIEQRIDASQGAARIPDFVKSITKEPPKKGKTEKPSKASKGDGSEKKRELPKTDLFEAADRDASQRGWFAAWRRLRRRVMAVPHIRQHDETDCGAACLAMIAKHYGKTIGLARLRDLTKMTLTGASLANLSEAAEAIGFTTKVVRTTVNLLGTLPMPCIALVHGMHYVVVWSITKKHVIVGDPAIGTVRHTREEFEKIWLGQMAMLMLPTENLHLQPKEKWALATFFPLISPYKGLLFEVFIASIILDLFGLAMPFFTQTIVDTVIVHQNWNLLNVMLIGMAVITIFRLLVGWLRGYLIAHISVKVDLRMLTLFFKHLLSLPLAFFTMRKTGDILARFGENQKIRNILTEAFISTLLDVMMIVIYITVMFLYNVQLTLALIAFLPLYAILMLVSRPILRKLSNQAFVANAEQESDLVESVQGVGTIKSMSLETHMRWKWEDHFANYLQVYFRAVKTQLVLSTIASAIQGFATLLLLWFGARLVLSGEMSIGQLMAFNAMLGSVMAPIGKLVSFWDEYQEAIIAIDRLNDVFQAKSEVTEEERIMTLDSRPPIRGGLEFQNVTFSYDENNVALQHVSFRIEPGHLVALVGRSGCGKTTLTKLLMRLYKPKDGKILVDGHEISSVDIGYLRKQIGIVVQENFLFSGTILQNIALGDENPSQLKAETAARVACAHQFIARLPFGYETPVGERGLSLSGGERQRLCIARAIYRNPQVLVFDEATSALDYQTEREIMDNIKAVFRDRTLVVIAHRLSTITNANQIVVLDRGLLREAGTHAELLEKNGLYAHLLRQQASKMDGM